MNTPLHIPFSNRCNQQMYILYIMEHPNQEGDTCAFKGEVPRECKKKYNKYTKNVFYFFECSRKRLFFVSTQVYPKKCPIFSSNTPLWVLPLYLALLAQQIWAHFCICPPPPPSPPL